MSARDPLDPRQDVSVLGASRASVVRQTGWGALLSTSVLVEARSESDEVDAAAQGVCVVVGVVIWIELCVMAAKALHRWLLRTYFTSQPVVVNVYDQSTHQYGYPADEQDLRYPENVERKRGPHERG